MKVSEFFITAASHVRDILLRAIFSHCALQNCGVLKRFLVCFHVEWGCGADIGVGRAGLETLGLAPCLPPLFYFAIDKMNIMSFGGKRIHC